MTKYEITQLAQGSTGIHSDSSRVADILQSQIGSKTKFVDPHYHSFSCIDGRGSDPILGTPGGDMGEFIITLTIYHRYNTLVHNAKTNVREIFGQYLKQVRPDQPFYMHTVRGAVDSLAKHLNISPDEVLNPTSREMQDKLLEHLIKPEFMGCGHIAYCMQFPEEYLVPQKLLQELIETFYKILWGYDESYTQMGQMQLCVLEGCHQEMGILEVTIPLNNKALRTSRGKEIKEDAQMFPLVSPITKRPNPQQPDQGDSVQFFVHHGKAVSVFRNKPAKFIQEILVDKFPQMNTRHIKIEIELLAEKMLMLSVGRLAPTLSMYQVVVHRD